MFFRRGTAIHGQFQKTAGARHGDGTPVRHRLVKQVKLTEPLAPHNYFASTFGQRGEQGVADIGNRVAEAVDLNNFAFD